MNCRKKNFIFAILLLCGATLPTGLFAKNCGASLGCMQKYSSVCSPTNGSQTLPHSATLNNGLRVWSGLSYTIPKQKASDVCKFNFTEVKTTAITPLFLDSLSAQNLTAKEISAQIRLVPHITKTHYSCSINDPKDFAGFMQKWRTGAFVDPLAFCSQKKDESGNFVDDVLECAYGPATCTTSIN